MRHLLTGFMLLALASTATNAETTVFRCGHEYTSVPCADARTIVVASAVTAEQRNEAHRVVLREKALAAEMARDRRAQEAALKPALAGSLSGVPPTTAPPITSVKKHPKKRRKTALPDDERDFVATVPKAKKPS